NCNSVLFEKGEKIPIQKDFSQHIVYIKNGMVKVHAKGIKREQILKVVKSPCFLGIPTTISSKINKFSITAISRTNVCFIPAPIFKEFVINNGNFAFEIIVELCNNELYYFNKALNQMQKQVPGKVADALLYFSNNIYETDKFELPLTRRELGDMTCSSRESVSRVLSDFKINKIIEINNKEVTILNKSSLERIAETG
ncbi:MAG TPA: Crp/Fnr family transcriptional regulator, partial [Bacteroidetes bacterium]|nr:Crp/Fnr family transcriptional regulator [Bacteroidota bacterium]